MLGNIPVLYSSAAAPEHICHTQRYCGFACESLYLLFITAQLSLTEQAFLVALREEEIQDDLRRITSHMPAEQEEEKYSSKNRKGRRGTTQPGQAKGGRKTLEGPCSACLDTCKLFDLVKL